MSTEQKPAWAQGTSTRLGQGKVRAAAIATLTLLFTIVVVLYSTGSIRHPRAYMAQSQRLTWSIPRLERVAMRIIPSSSRYRMGAEAWNHLLPKGGHIVHLSEPDGNVSTHTVAMFHQLRCLEILQEAYVNEGSHRTSPLAQHCMNYLRQTMLCQMDMRTEIQGSVFTYNGFDQMCHDWEPLYQEADRNYDAYNKLAE